MPGCSLKPSGAQSRGSCQMVPGSGGSRLHRAASSGGHCPCLARLGAEQPSWGARAARGLCWQDLGDAAPGCASGAGVSVAAASRSG